MIILEIILNIQWTKIIALGILRQLIKERYLTRFIMMSW
jgi:hypothetical protein